MTDPSEASGLSAADFLLPPEEFIKQCARRLGLSSEQLDDEAVMAFAEALRSGTARFSVIRALQSLRDPVRSRANWHGFLNIDVDLDHSIDAGLIERFAPNDNLAFLRFAFMQVCGRGPTALEQLGYEFDLRRGVRSRSNILAALVMKARSEGRNVEPLPQSISGHSDEGSLRPIKGRLGYAIVRRGDGTGWSYDPGLWHQTFDTVEDGWKVRSGWILTSQKRTLEPGLWEIAVDLIQLTTARVHFDFVASHGLETLFSVMLVGPAAFTTCIELTKPAPAAEVRLFKPEQQPHEHWLNVRTISMVKVA
jgi:hypothetical protein